MPSSKKKKRLQAKKKPLHKKSASKKITPRKKLSTVKRTQTKKEMFKPSLPEGPKPKPIGKITHYFPRVMAGVVKLSAPLSIGDSIYIKGHTTDFKQTVTSIQIDRVPIKQAKKGQEIGLLVISRVRRGDKVYKL